MRPSQKLTGGDVLTGRFMRGDFFDFHPSHLILVLSNHLPAVGEGGPHSGGESAVFRSFMSSQKSNGCWTSLSNYSPRKAPPSWDRRYAEPPRCSPADSPIRQQYSQPPRTPASPKTPWPVSSATNAYSDLTGGSRSLTFVPVRTAL